MPVLSQLPVINQSPPPKRHTVASLQHNLPIISTAPQTHHLSLAWAKPFDRHGSREGFARLGLFWLFLVSLLKLPHPKQA